MREDGKYTSLNLARSSFDFGSVIISSKFGNSGIISFGTKTNKLN